MLNVKELAAFGLALLLTAGASAQTGPVIEDVEPTSGPPGTLVHVTGRRFPPDAKVSIGGRVLASEQRLPNRISVRVPAGAASGPVAVTGSTGSVRGLEFRVTPPAPAPAIDGIEPASGRPGSKVVLRGKNFSSRLAANTVTLGGRPAVVLSATPQALEVSVPAGASSGPFVVKVQPGGEARSKAFTVTAHTAITGFTPERGLPGTELTIRGQGFATEPARNRVFLGNLPLPVKRASEQELVVTLPTKIASGELLVDVRDGGRAVAPTPLVVQLAPSVVSFSPLRGKPGTVVKVRGTNFGNNAQVVEARIGEAKLLVRSAARTLLELEIPADAQTGKLSIRVLGIGPAWSERPFTVVVPPAPKGVKPMPSATPAAVPGTKPMPTPASPQAAPPTKPVPASPKAAPPRPKPATAPKPAITPIP
jgi:hypothetical protein